MAFTTAKIYGKSITSQSIFKRLKQMKVRESKIRGIGRRGKENYTCGMEISLLKKFINLRIIIYY